MWSDLMLGLAALVVVVVLLLVLVRGDNDDIYWR